MGGAATSYRYDGDGNRFDAVAGGVTTTSVYDVNAALPVLLEDGSRKYVWGLGLAYAVDSSNSIEVFHDDGLGSVRAITDATGSVVQTYHTDEFDVPIPSGTQGTRQQPFQYTGEPRDPTGLVQLRARLYKMADVLVSPWSTTGRCGSKGARHDFAPES